METEIRPATFLQVRNGHGGAVAHVHRDVSEFARKLEDIDSSLRLRHNLAEDYFVVYQLIEHPDGSQDEQLVTTAQELDERLINRVRMVCSEHYDLDGELRRIDAAASRAQDRAFEEKVGPHAEKLAHALRKDFGDKSRAAGFRTFGGGAK